MIMKISETICYYVSLRDAGYPVILNNAEKIKKIVDRKGYVGILPEHISPAGFPVQTDSRKTSKNISTSWKRISTNKGGGAK